MSAPHRPAPPPPPNSHVFRVRSVGYYPDTPLSLNHAIMKDKPKRPDDAAPAQLPRVSAFGASPLAK